MSTRRLIRVYPDTRKATNARADGHTTADSECQNGFFKLDIIKPMLGGERESGLVDLDARVDLLREPEAGQEAARAREQKQPDADEAHVAEVEHVREPLVRAQSPEVVDAIRKHVEGCRTTGQERPPPPAVVLATQLEVA